MRRPPLSLALPLLALPLSLASAASATGRDVRLNEVQVIGSHNSYHVQPPPELIDLYVQFDPAAIFWEYTHRPLVEQFALLGIRQIELDIVVDDPQGGRYAHPLAPELIGLSIHLPEHEVPGLKVIHVPDLDFDEHVHAVRRVPRDSSGTGPTRTPAISRSWCSSS